MKRIFLSIFALFTVAALQAQTKTPVDGYPRFALGADISWTPYIEENNIHKYFTANGEATNVEELIAFHAIDAIRVRVWVNPKSDMAMGGFKFKISGSTWEVMPTYGTCSAEDITALALRFALQGQRIMVAFHFSDQWADPARQFIPADWADCTSIDELSEKAVNHVREVLSAMHDSNINVAWVQIGNETNTGMMKWNLPSTSGAGVDTAAFGCEIGQTGGSPSETTKNFVRVFADVANAAREIYPETKTVLHLAQATQWNSVNWTLALLKKAGFSDEICDYVGLSLYPGAEDGREDYTADWQKYADLGITTINNINKDYGFRSLLCEIGMNNEWSASTSASDQASNIVQCNKDVRDFTQYLIDNLAYDESTCDGLFYWEPETDYLKEYKKGACVAKNPGSSWPRDKVVPNDWWRTIKENSTFPLGGLEDYVISDDPQTGIDKTMQAQQHAIFTLQGVRTSKPARGVYILDKKKVLVK